MSLWRDQNRNFMRNKLYIYGFITIARLIPLQVAFFHRGYQPPSSQYFATDMVH
jgi:hypothetical protein